MWLERGQELESLSPALLASLVCSCGEALRSSRWPGVVPQDMQSLTVEMGMDQEQPGAEGSVVLSCCAVSGGNVLVASLLGSEGEEGTALCEEWVQCSLQDTVAPLVCFCGERGFALAGET